MELETKPEDTNQEQEPLQDNQTTITPRAQEPNSNPSSNIPLGHGPTEGLEEDSKMMTSEMGLEDMELSDILEQEGMDIPNMVEQWKNKGVEHISEEEVNRINTLFIARQKAEMDMQRRSLGTTKGLGVRAQGLHQTTTNPKHQKKWGIRTNNEALQELGQILLNLGKMKALKAFTLSS